MFTLRIKSPSGLESVAHSQLLLFSGASSESAFKGCFAALLTGKPAHARAHRYNPVQQLASLGNHSVHDQEGLVSMGPFLHIG